MKSAHKRELPYIIFLIVVIVHIFLLCQIGLKREYMFTDEVYSYGLANSENYSFLDPDNNPTLLNWTKNLFSLTISSMMKQPLFLSERHL